MSKLIIPIGIMCLLFAVFVYNEFTGNTIENYRLRSVAGMESSPLKNGEYASTTRSINLSQATGEIDDLTISLDEGMRIEREISTAFDEETFLIINDNSAIDEFNRVYDENTI